MRFEPNQKQVTAGFFKEINGVWHKRCTGPAHDEPTYLPATEKYFYTRKGNKRYGQFTSQCRLCCNWKGIDSPGLHGLVDVSVVWHFYNEAVNRVGLMELSRRTGLNWDGLSKVLHKEVRSVRKSNLRKVMLELISMRRKNEHSINGFSKRWAHQRLTRGSQTCAGCGTPQSNYTDGCATCWERRRGISRRAA